MNLNTYKKPYLAFIFCAFLTACGQPNSADNSKQSGTIKSPDISVSGLSSGAYMAMQFHLAHSERVIGSALIAGGPYFCAQGDIGTALQNCVAAANAPIDLNGLTNTIENYQQQGLLSAPSFNKHDKVWLLHGTLDTRINRSVADKLHSQVLSMFDTTNVRYVNDKAFAHLMPTLNQGNSCSESASPFIGQCNYDAAGELLTHIAHINKPKSDLPAAELNKQLIMFKQADYAGEYSATLGDEGYVFVPDSCEANDSCDIHISFHGCNQNAEAIGDQFARQSGLNEWAQNNRLIVLYPQTKKSAFMPLNPQACWDWWGYTGENYANKDGKQINAVMSLVENIPAIVKANSDKQ